MIFSLATATVFRNGAENGDLDPTSVAPCSQEFALRKQSRAVQEMSKGAFNESLVA